MPTELYVTMKFINITVAPHIYSKFTSFQNEEFFIPLRNKLSIPQKKIWLDMQLSRLTV